MLHLFQGDALIYNILVLSSQSDRRFTQIANKSVRFNKAKSYSGFFRRSYKQGQLCLVIFFYEIKK